MENKMTCELDNMKSPNKILSFHEQTNAPIISSFFDTFGINYSVIDSEGNYITQNNAMIADISQGLINAEKIDKPSWENCKAVMKRKKRIIKEELFQDKYYLSIKQPLIKGKECLGIVVLSFDITERKKQEIALQTVKDKAEAELRAKELTEGKNRKKFIFLRDALKEIKQTRYYLAGKHKGIYLTRREAQCMICLERGQTAKEMGKFLNLSYRTIETHVDNIKSKLNCSSRSALIKIAIENSFLNEIAPIEKK